MLMLVVKRSIRISAWKMYYLFGGFFTSCRRTSARKSFTNSRHIHFTKKMNTRKHDENKLRVIFRGNPRKCFMEKSKMKQKQKKNKLIKRILSSINLVSESVGISHWRMGIWGKLMKLLSNAFEWGECSSSWICSSINP
jgi:hypothetical protein